jgi:3-phytase
MQKQISTDRPQPAPKKRWSLIRATHVCLARSTFSRNFMVQHLVITAFLITASTGILPNADAPSTAVVKEVFFTTDQTRENIDSPSSWHGNDGQHLLFATSKEAHSVNVFDAINGAMLQRIGGQGLELGQFNRPNGVTVVDDLMLVVERDNRRVQVLSIPDFKPITSFGESELDNPYGLHVEKLKAGEYHVYVTDNYETPTGEIPSDQDLGLRVRRYLLEVEGTTGEGELDLSFGDTSGPGRLFVVESIFGDRANGNLLIADELEEKQRGRQVKVYDFEGNFTGKTFGNGLFESQVEGIALYETSETNGYWFVADQGKIRNSFHIFDRRTFQHLGTLQGERTLNTDGIWITQTPMLRFPHGALYACDNDKAISAFNLTEVFSALGLTP